MKLISWSQPPAMIGQKPRPFIDAMFFALRIILSGKDPKQRVAV